jgi:hypothetical protein
MDEQALKTLLLSPPSDEKKNAVVVFMVDLAEELGDTVGKREMAELSRMTMLNTETATILSANPRMAEWKVRALVGELHEYCELRKALAKLDAHKERLYWTLKALYKVAS